MAKLTRHFLSLTLPPSQPHDPRETGEGGAEREKKDCYFIIVIIIVSQYIVLILF